jgi:hypothetical protein
MQRPHHGMDGQERASVGNDSERYLSSTVLHPSSNEANTATASTVSIAVLSKLLEQNSINR